MQRFVYDIVVVGGGIIGTATARELLKRNPTLKLALLEKERTLAFHQSGRNSGVIHSGIYYTPGSLKAKLCVEGMQMVYEFCDQHHLPYKKCGKLIVAVKESELKYLEALYERAIANNVKDISLVDKEGIKQIEPNVFGLKAIWSPNTGIVNWADVCRSFAEDCKSKGADIHLNFEVKAFRPFVQGSGTSIVICGKTQDIMCQQVITCGGLYSDHLARMTGCNPVPQIVPFRGDYLILKPNKSHLVKTNIYPVPHPGLPFLGVHFTPRMDGSVWLGPNAVLSFSREGYERFAFRSEDAMQILNFRGLRKLASNNLTYGLQELYRSFNINAQVNELKNYLPMLTSDCVIRGPSGVRAQAVDSAGDLVDDFVFDEGRREFEGRVLHLRNAPSPAATSSLAIAKVIADRVQDKFLEADRRRVNRV